MLFKFWRTFTPESEWFTRFPSVAAAVAAAALTGLLGARPLNQAAGVLAGILLATNATVVSWSEQTRTYALATLMAVVAHVSLSVRAMESDDRRKLLVYGIAGAVGIYAHFFIGFVLASHAVLWRSMSTRQRRHLLEAWRSSPSHSSLRCLSSSSAGIPAPTGFLRHRGTDYEWH